MDFQLVRNNNKYFRNCDVEIFRYDETAGEGIYHEEQ